LSRTATIGRTVVVAVVVGGTGGRHRCGTTANDKVAVRVSQCRTLDTLWFAWKQQQ
jgi:hypothetical protein